MKNIEIESVNQLLLCHRVSHNKNNHQIHLHNNAYEITLFKTGNVDYFIQDYTYHLHPGDLMLIRPNEIHGFFAKDNSQYERLPVHINVSLARYLCSSDTNLLKCFDQIEKGTLRHLSEKQRQDFELYVDTIIEYQQQQAFGLDIYIRSYISLILLLANNAHTNKRTNLEDITPSLIHNAISYINDNITSPLTIQTVAEHINLSSSRFSHIFKEYTGTSPWKYIITKRMQLACTLLREGSSVSDCCYECGFNNYAHFVKLFTQVNGISPGKYARNLSVNHDQALITNLRLDASFFNH